MPRQPKLPARSFVAVPQSVLLRVPAAQIDEPRMRVSHTAPLPPSARPGGTLERPRIIYSAIGWPLGAEQWQKGMRSTDLG